MEGLSVIIPNYNNAKYITQCVESIVSQSYLPTEIIIVDDCSTDNSVEVIERLRELHQIIKPVFLKKNGGVSNARNVGLQNAVTQYVTFIDADDFYYNQEKLKNEMSIIQSYNSEKVLAYSVTAYVDPQGALLPIAMNNRIKREQFIEGKALIDIVSMRKQKRIPRDYIIEKDVLTGVGGYSYPVNFYEDLDLLMRLAEAGVCFCCTYKFGTGYRQSEVGLSKRSHEEHISARRSIQLEYYKRLSTFQKVQCSILMTCNSLTQKTKKFLKSVIKKK